MVVELLCWLFLIVWLTLATYSLWHSDIYTCCFTGEIHIFVIKEHCKYHDSSTIIYCWTFVTTKELILYLNFYHKKTFPRISCCQYPLSQWVPFLKFQYDSKSDILQWGRPIFVMPVRKITAHFTIGKPHHQHHLPPQ